MFIFTSISVSLGQDVTLSWDPSPTSEVAGYKVYYKQGDMNYPFNGTGANEGPSPLDVGDVLSTTLTNLPNDTIYFFAVTAYVDNGQESAFSNIVSNSWIPSLLLPANNATGEPVPVTFQWETAPSGYAVSYTLFYGTNRDEVTRAIVIAPFSTATRYTPNIPIIFIMSTLLLLFISVSIKWRKNSSPQAIVLATTVLIVGVLAACGGGGSSSGEHSTIAPTGPAETTLFSVNKGDSDYHQAYDLKGSTTYYWKVVATGTQNPNLTYESAVNQFTTEYF